MTEAEKLVRAYYAAFNAGDFAAMLALLTDDVVHGINQGGRETGRDSLRPLHGRHGRQLPGAAG